MHSSTDRCVSIEAAECAPAQPHLSDLLDSEAEAPPPDTPVASAIGGIHGTAGIIESADTMAGNASAHFG
jgi:hypothetical protein